MSQYIVNEDGCVRMNPFAGVAMHAMEAEKMTLSIVDMAPHSVIEEHSHPHEQIGYMVEGEAEFVVAGESVRVHAGQMWRLPGGVPHKVITGEKSMRAIDVFYPVREDMRGTWTADSSPE
ncbi:MAG: cupin domain-containing protein [Planctomycetota bacterium]